MKKSSSFDLVIQKLHIDIFRAFANMYERDLCSHLNLASVRNCSVDKHISQTVVYFFFFFPSTIKLTAFMILFGQWSDLKSLFRFNAFGWQFVHFCHYYSLVGCVVFFSGWAWCVLCVIRCWTSWLADVARSNQQQQRQKKNDHVWCATTRKCVIKSMFNYPFKCKHVYDAFSRIDGRFFFLSLHIIHLNIGFAINEVVLITLIYLLVVGQSNSMLEMSTTFVYLSISVLHIFFLSMHIRLIYKYSHKFKMVCIADKHTHKKRSNNISNQYANTRHTCVFKQSICFGHFN